MIKDTLALENLHNNMALTPEQLKEIRGELNISPTRQTSRITAQDKINQLRGFSAEQVTPEVQEKGFLQKTGKFLFGGGALEAGASLLKPTIKAIETVGFQPIREIQKILPGGRTGEEEIETPFGRIKDLKKQTFGENIETGIEIGALVLPVEKVLSPVFKFFGGAFKRFGGTITGKGADIIEQIVKNPEQAKIGLRGKSVDILKDMATSARDAVIDLSKASQAKFKDSLDKLPVNINVTLSQINNKLVDNLSELGVKINRGSVGLKEKLDFTETSLRGSEEKILREVFQTINKWKDLSGEGLNRLAVKIGNFTKAGDQSNALNSIIGKTKTSIREVLGDVVPEAKEMVTRFAKEQDFIDALRKELSVKNNLKSTEGIIGIANKIQNIFSANKDLTQDLFRSLDIGEDILSKEAGRQLAQTPSRAAVSIGDTARGIAQTVISPKMIGEIAAATGIAINKIKPFTDILQTFAPVERIALINSIISLFGDSQEDQR